MIEIVKLENRGLEANLAQTDPALKPGVNWLPGAAKNLRIE